MLKRVTALLAGTLIAVTMVSDPAQADEDLPSDGTWQYVGPYSAAWVCEAVRSYDYNHITRACFDLAAPWNGNSWYYVRLI
ncbi:MULTISPECIES: hypothetical protein [Streptosporangium]|uniref:Uncharacterized protein n=1 Tax=Streptosporangium brasiliense TaxID=47480 RepID=A0ABT9RK40_9ACTN|nr:hypothetical protein [Streptosporangium brasiliense]MDP9869212.1 hypothetical protein [Streptosporangium brasiliense]